MPAQVRHPNVLAFKDMLEVEDKHEVTIYVVTEPVTPLAETLAELDVQGEARCAASRPDSSSCVQSGWQAADNQEGPLAQSRAGCACAGLRCFCAQVYLQVLRFLWCYSMSYGH